MRDEATATDDIHAASQPKKTWWHVAKAIIDEMPKVKTENPWPTAWQDAREAVQAAKQAAEPIARSFFPADAVLTRAR